MNVNWYNKRKLQWSKRQWSTSYNSDDAAGASFSASLKEDEPLDYFIKAIVQITLHNCYALSVFLDVRHPQELSVKWPHLRKPCMNLSSCRKRNASFRCGCGAIAGPCMKVANHRTQPSFESTIGGRGESHCWQEVACCAAATSPWLRRKRKCSVLCFPLPLFHWYPIYSRLLNTATRRNSICSCLGFTKKPNYLVPFR